MSFPAWAMRSKYIVVSLVGLLMLWGVIAFFTMPRREDPEFTIRVCVVTTRWTGAPAETMEALVTDKIEQELQGIEEVKLTRSTTRTAQSTIFVELEDRIAPDKIQNIWDKVRARVNLVPMPAPNVHPIVNDSFGDTWSLLLSVHHTQSHDRKEIRKQDRYSKRQLEVFAERVQDELRLLKGVARVDRFGERKEAIYIEADQGTWAQQGITTSQLRRIASDRNIIEPGGEIDTRTGHFLVKTGGEFDAVDEIGRLASIVRSGEDAGSVLLRDLGLSVKRDFEDPPTYICRYGDKSGSTDAVTLGITMKSGANIIDICDRSMARVHELLDIEQVLPRDIAVTPVSDQSKNVSRKIDEVISNVIQAILIVVLVVFLAVGLRASFVMPANIPVVVSISIGLISSLGVQLEQISLAALIISLGLLVDNAVQVCDQTRVNLAAGMRPFRAATTAAETLAIPMLVGTLTTIAAFLPMLFALDGGKAEYVRSLPITVSTTLALSWVLAMSFCVLLAALFIRAPKDNTPSSPVVRVLSFFASLFRRKNSAAATPSPARENAILRFYDVTSRFAIRHKWLSLLMGFGFIAGLLQLPVQSEFFPEAPRDQFAVKVFLPATASIHDSDAVAKDVETILEKLAIDPATGKERLRCYRTIVGGGGARWHLGWEPEPRSRNFAEILVRTTDRSLTGGFAKDLRTACRRGLPEQGIEAITAARVVPIELALGPPADPLVLRVIGPGFADSAELRQISQELRHIVAAQPETWNVHDSWGMPGLDVEVHVDQEQALLAGVTNAQIAATLNSYYSGLELTRFREGDHQIPIYFRLRPEERGSIRGLQEAFVEGDRGKVPLGSLASFEPRFQVSKIRRRSRNRVIEVNAKMEAGVTGNDVVNRVLGLPETKALIASMPPGYRIEPGGAYEQSLEAGGQMLLSFAISFVLIILCLIFQYNGWSKPIVVLSTLPFGFVGAWLGLWMMDQNLGFMSQLGILALFGIVLNTAIIFIEFADLSLMERAKNSDGSGPIAGVTKDVFHDALVDAGKQRMLPIFLTTATTVGGLLPLALYGGPLWAGLAWCMSIGLLTTTVLTLYLVPALYAILVESFRVRPIPAAPKQVPPQ